MILLRQTVTCRIVKMYKIFRRHVGKLQSIKSEEKMCAIQFDGREKTLEIIEKTRPQHLNEKTVLIKMAYAGVSGIDLKIIAGEWSPITAANEKLILGHEMCGVVCKSAANFQKGDRVAVNPTRGCQVCAHCREKNEHYCAQIEENHVGIGRDGGWQEYCAVPAAQLHKIPANVSTAAAITAHALSCVRHAWHLLKPIAHGANILIIGAGYAANLFTGFFHFNGHKRVTVCEENIRKLATTAKLNTCYDLITPDVLAQRTIKSQFYDVIVDCSGDCKAIEGAARLLADGGRFCIFGTASADAIAQISPYEVFRRELNVFAPKLNPCWFPGAFDAIQAMGERYVCYEKLGIHLFKLREYRDALSCVRRGTITKAVFCFNEPEDTQI